MGVAFGQEIRSEIHMRRGRSIRALEQVAVANFEAMTDPEAFLFGTLGIKIRI